MVAGKFEERATRVPADRVMIRFGPEVRKHLKELEKITDHPAFDDNMHEILKSLNSTKPTEIQFAITQLAMVVRNVTQFAQERPAFWPSHSFSFCSLLCCRIS